MSKQNRRTNYTNCSSKKPNDEPQNSIADEATESVEVNISAEATESSEASNHVGVVVGCEKLNVRKEPSINSEVVFQFPCSMEVEIFAEKSTEDWFYVCNAAGIEGFCMKKYIDSRK